VSWLNIPNALSVVRLALTPVIVLRILAIDFRAALWLLAIAGLTDALDGFVARKFALTTRIGLILDPIADKVLLTSTYIALGVADALPWWLVLLVVGRDLFLLTGTGLVMLLTTRRSFPPSIWGKISTILQIVTGIWALIAWVPEIALGLTALATVWSGVHYLMIGSREVLAGRSKMSR
jgi:cardiolipin synthase